MSIRFYNSLTRSIEEFVPHKAGEVTLYSCGPTVYNFVHIGNLRCYIFNDLLRRYLRYRGFALRHVMNLTDIDDKTIRGAKAAGKPLREFTEGYAQEFLQDLKTLNIETPEIMPRATDHIGGMVAMIEELLRRGAAYRTSSGDIYFRIESFSKYGALANIDLSRRKANADGRLSNADTYEKDDVNDFALWKAYDPEDGEVFWETTIGKGRPGWHIECSVMASHFLGQPIDIHTGGIDLLFPHHTNEIAQSECACDGTFVRLWMHNEHLLVNGKKMSKSLNNFFTLRDLLAKGYDPAGIRFELIKTHYRQQLDFREENFAGSVQALRKFWDFMDRLAEAGAGAGWSECSEVVESARTGFVAALDDDLNISVAFAAVYEFMNRVNANLAKLTSPQRDRVVALMKEFDQIFGFVEMRPATTASDESGAEIDALLRKRDEARKAKDFKAADAIRDELLSRGIAIKDGPQGARWYRV